MWKNISINKNQVEVETAKSVLIKCPNNSSYSGMVFWHPAKLVRTGKHSSALSLGYTNDFTFTLRKMGNGKYNGKEVIREEIIDVKEFEEMFGVVDENITAPKVDTESYVEVKEPVKIDKEVVVEECLMNN